MSDLSDRLKSQPPFVDEEGKATEEPKEEPGEITEEAPVEEEPEEPKEEQEELPKDATERTKEQFEKLTTSNKKLKEENDKIKEEARKLAKDGALGAVVDAQPKPDFDWNQMLVNQAPPAQHFPGMTQKQVEDVFLGLVDEEGYVNTDLLRDELRKSQTTTKQALEEAKKAREEARASRRQLDDYQRSQIAREVHNKYPELDPDSEEFNPDYFEAVRDKMIANLSKGSEEDFMGSAKSLYERYNMTKKEEVKKAKDTADAAAQINATGSKSQAPTRGKFGDEDELRKAMWKGKRGAVAEALKRAGL